MKDIIDEKLATIAIRDALFENTQRQVVLAEWVEGTGQDGHYELKLSCGHTLRCSPTFLRSHVLCTQCLGEG